ncbi:sulfatase family protein [Consotaella aegiceratis]|uniref:sulfatase family protein n=1 Tax=Consotaella aegiceratis TaxID=3097961 RepID=UPI002F42425A
MTSPRPNIVLVITDQQRFDTIAALGFPHMITPNLDRMVREGVAFRQMFVTAPSCAPSRASLFTGLYPHTNGVLRNDDRWTWSWVECLADAGYRCVNIGKMHTFPYEQSFGFHERHVTENKDRAHPSLPYFLDNWDKALWARGLEKPSRVTYRRRADYRDRLGAFVWELPEDMHSDNFVGDLACHWLDSYTGEEPFFLEIGIPGPHPPYDPTPDALALYADRDVPLPILDEAEQASQPQPLKDLRREHWEQDHDAVVHLPDPTDEQVLRQRRHYFANVTMIDAQIGHLIATLDRRGVLDDTIVIFTSDHGDCLNDHGHSQKWNMYEQTVHVPAVIWGPGLTAGGRQVDDLAELMDWGPTILELAGITPPSWMQARSLLPLITGEGEGSRRYVFSEHARDAILKSTECMTMIRDHRWKLVHFVDSDEGQLFDLEADPREVRNLWDEPSHQGQKNLMIDEILRWRTRTALDSQNWRPQTS